MPEALAVAAELVLLLQLGPRVVVTRCAVEVLPEPVLPEVLAVVAEFVLLLPARDRSVGADRPPPCV